MVLEIADIAVLDGQQNEFAAAYREAVALLAGTEGCRGTRMTRSVETPTRFVLLVEWDSVEAHLVGFRESAAFTRWRALIGPYFDGPPHTEHFHDVPAA